MRKLIIILVLFLSAVPSCLAGDDVKEAQKAVSLSEDITHHSGRVESISAPQIVILADSGEKVILAVTPMTLAYDADMNLIALNKIKVNERVNIKCTPTEAGVCEAREIYVSKDDRKTRDAW